jgi:hypothetical protein
MATIDNLDISVHFEYARRSQSVEYTQRMLRLDQADAIPGHTKIYNLSPQLQDIEELFGFRKSVVPWALFDAPDNFFEQRRSSFAFDRLCPSLGTQEEQESYLETLKNCPYLKDKNHQGQQDDFDEDDDENAKLSSTITKRKKKTIKEQESLIFCIQEILNINKLINFVTSRIGQFLQG